MVTNYNKEAYQQIKKWEEVGWKKWDKDLSKVKINIFVKYVTKKGGVMKALPGGFVISNKPDKGYLILKNLQSFKTWWAKYDHIYGVWYKPTKAPKKSK